MKQRTDSKKFKCAAGFLRDMFKGLLAFLGFIAFCMGLYQVHLGNLKNAGTAIGAGAIILVFAFLSQFKRFKGFGIEAETWEQTMEEAKDLIAELRQLSVLTAEHLLSVAVRLGRADTHLSRRERFELRQKIEKMLADSGIASEEIKRVTSESRRFELIDMASDLCELIQDYTEGKYNKKAEVASEVRELQAFIRENIKTLPEIFPSKLQSCATLSADDKAFLKAHVEDELKRIETFRSSGKILDQEEWLSRKVN